MPTDEQWQSDLLCIVLDMLNYAGVFKALVGVADKLLENLTDRVFEELMYPVFGSMPGIWSFVTDDEYEQAKKMAFDENTSKRLISRLDEYHYNVQCKAGEILNRAKNNGVKIMIVAGYNKQRTPLVESYMSNSDATVDTKYASVGATVADLGSALPEGYVQKNEAGVHDHLSKDGVIDASTCLLPENTWFIKDMLHCKIHDGHKEMYNLFFYSDSVTDVWSNEKYPQFLQNDVNAKTLTPIGTQARPGCIERRFGQLERASDPADRFGLICGGYPAPVCHARGSCFEAAQTLVRENCNSRRPYVPLPVVFSLTRQKYFVKPASSLLK